MISLPLLAIVLGNLAIYWHLPIVVVVISLVYSATRYDQWDYIQRETIQWVVRMLAFLLVIVLVLYVLSIWI